MEAKWSLITYVQCMPQVYMIPRGCGSVKLVSEDLQGLYLCEIVQQ